MRGREARPAGYCNRRIEETTRQLGGIKSLYSEAYFSEKEFWQIYNGPAYAALKQRYDPLGKFSDLFQKCVQKS